MKDIQSEETCDVTLTVAQQLDRMRLDLFLDHCFATYTRSFFKKLIDTGMVTHNTTITTKASTRVTAGDTVTVTFPPQRSVHPLRHDHYPLGITVIAEHDAFLVIDKPAGLLVHPPAHGSSAVTLADWLVTYYPETHNVGDPERPGIVHRLDKDTSGILLVARTQHAYDTLQHAFKQRDVTKVYYAIVRGHPEPHGTIQYNIERDPIHRQQMIHTQEGGRHAITEYHVVEYFEDHTLLKLRPTTGRTHQIRVHANAIGHPILGDGIYGKKSSIIDRQALHAHTLAFTYNHHAYTYRAPFPRDLQKALWDLRKRAL